MSDNTSDYCAEFTRKELFDAFTFTQLVKYGVMNLPEKGYHKKFFIDKEDDASSGGTFEDLSPKQIKWLGDCYMESPQLKDVFKDLQAGDKPDDKLVTVKPCLVKAEINRLLLNLKSHTAKRVDEITRLMEQL